MTTKFRALRALMLGCCLTAALQLQGCGGGGGGGGDSSTTTTTTTPTTTTTTTATGSNVIPVTVQRLAGTNTPNVVYATVTVCAPDGTNCVAIPNVMVDTASTGLRLNASALSNLASLPRNNASNGNPLSECYTFLDGYFWGSVRSATVTLGGETATNIPVQVVNDSAAGSVPAGCSSAGSTSTENTAATVVGNGILGVQGYTMDCGATCADITIEGFYYSCPAAGCTATAEPMGEQLGNPVTKLLTSDSNGVVLRLPAIDPNGAATVSGTMLLGVGTQANNSITGSTILATDSSYDFTASFNGTTASGSFVDSGSNALFFQDSSIPTCSGSTWYCPTSDVTGNVTFTGNNNSGTYSSSFTVRSATSLFANAYGAYSTLAGNEYVGSVMDFGLPFFFGKNIAVIADGYSVPGTSTTGPAVAFGAYTSN